MVRKPRFDPDLSTPIYPPRFSRSLAFVDRLQNVFPAPDQEVFLVVSELVLPAGHARIERVSLLGGGRVLGCLLGRERDPGCVVVTRRNRRRNS